MSSELNTPFPLAPRIDASSRYGACVLAAHIVAVWRARGFRHVTAERYQVTETAWGVRSNLVNGLPSR